MTRHSAHVAVLAVLGIATFFAFWWMIANLLLSAMPQFLHSNAEIAFGAFVFLMMAVAVLSGLLVGIQAYHPAAHREQHFGFHRPHLRH